MNNLWESLLAAFQARQQSGDNTSSKKALLHEKAKLGRAKHRRPNIVARRRARNRAARVSRRRNRGAVKR